MNTRDEHLFKEILKYCREASYAHKYFHEDKGLFYDDEKGQIYRSAVAMDAFQIGEQARSLSPEVCQVYPDIPWGGTIKMRETFSQTCGEWDYDTIWNTSFNDIPILAERVRRILEDNAQD